MKLLVVRIAEIVSLFMIVLLVLMALSIDAHATMRVYEAEIEEYNFETSLIIKIRIPGRVQDVSVEFSDHPRLNYRQCPVIDGESANGPITIACDIDDIAYTLEPGRCYQVRVRYTYPPKRGRRLQMVADHMTVCYFR